MQGRLAHFQSFTNSNFTESFTNSNFPESFAVLLNINSLVSKTLPKMGPAMHLYCFVNNIALSIAHVNNIALSIVVRCKHVESGVSGVGRVSWRELVRTYVRA